MSLRSLIKLTDYDVKGLSANGYTGSRVRPPLYVLQVQLMYYVLTVHQVRKYMKDLYVQNNYLSENVRKNKYLYEDGTLLYRICTDVRPPQIFV